MAEIVVEQFCSVVLNPTQQTEPSQPRTRLVGGRKYQRTVSRITLDLDISEKLFRHDDIAVIDWS